MDHDAAASSISDQAIAERPARTADSGTAPEPRGTRRTRGIRPAALPPGRSAWPGVAAAAAVAGLCYLWGIAGNGTNYYYDAAVRGMARSWHNFFYAAYDPGGYITIDKSPGGVWMQALSARFFGYHSWALLLPQALAGIATVPLLFAVVRRWAGDRAGVLAAFVFALTPTMVAATRINIPDAFLMLCMVGAAYTFWRALEDGRWSWIIGTGALLGLGFQVKLVLAFVIAPVLGGVYLWLAAEPMARRWAKAGTAGAVTLAVSSLWMLLFVLTPGGSRPYVDGSTRDSVWQMAFAYNVFGRTGNDTGVAAGGAAKAGAFFRDGQPAPVTDGGGTGLTRMFNEQVGDQISWLLPLALIFAAVCTTAALRRPGTPPLVRAGWLLWSGWLLLYGLVFSLSSDLHPYYTMMLAPAIAALVGAGISGALEHRDTPLGRWVLPAGVLVTGYWAQVLLYRERDYLPWLRLVVFLASAGAVALVYLLPRRELSRRLLVATTALTALTLLLAPAVWILETLSPPPGGSTAFFAGFNPLAGPGDPQTSRRGGQAGGPGGGQGGMSAAVMDRPITPDLAAAAAGLPLIPPPVTLWGLPAEADPRLVAFLRHGNDGEQYDVAVTGATGAAPYISRANLRVLPMGGFAGTAPAPSVPELAGLVRSGRLRFVLFGGFAYQSPTSRARTAWVTANCRKVNPVPISSTVRMAATSALFDCRP